MKRSKAIVKRMEDQAQVKEQLLKDIEYIDPLSMNVKATHHKSFAASGKFAIDV